MTISAKFPPVNNKYFLHCSIYVAIILCIVAIPVAIHTKYLLPLFSNSFITITVICLPRFLGVFQKVFGIKLVGIAAIF